MIIGDGFLIGIYEERKRLRGWKRTKFTIEFWFVLGGCLIENAWRYLFR